MQAVEISSKDAQNHFYRGLDIAKRFPNHDNTAKTLIPILENMH